MKTGIVLFFDEGLAGGGGLIEDDNGGSEVFFDHSVLSPPDYEPLAGDAVEYDLEDSGSDDLWASHVSLL